MSPEAFLLALTTVVRPTTVAALFGILSTSHPQRLLIAYLIAGLGFSLTVGALVVIVLQGVNSATSSSSRPVFDILLGGAALGYASAVLAGWRPRRNASDPADPPRGWMHRHLHGLSVRGAAAAGVLTHLPGLVYLAALNAIAASAPKILTGLFNVAVYNAIWFSLPILALVLAVRRPEASRSLLERIRTLVLRYRRGIVVLFLVALGGYLVVTGFTELAAI